MRKVPKLYTTQATLIADGKMGYKPHVPEAVFIQENKYDERVAIFRMKSDQNHAGYYLYNSLEAIRLDFELTELFISERR